MFDFGFEHGNFKSYSIGEIPKKLIGEIILH